MRIKNLIIISLLLMFSSCFVHKGQIKDGKCRPKNPNFDLLKIPFRKTENLTFNKVYTLNDLKKIGIGFYDDGRIILVKNYDYEKQNYDLITPFFMESKNWNEPDYIGYWRVDEGMLKTEYFSCSNSGDYIKGNAKVVGDTLFFERDCSKSPIKSEKCFDKYILSDIEF
jgi:hypothetical protein